MSKKHHPQEEPEGLPPLDETVRRMAEQQAHDDAAFAIEHGIELTLDTLDLLAWRRAEEAMNRLFGPDDSHKKGRKG